MQCARKKASIEVVIGLQFENLAYSLVDTDTFNKLRSSHAPRNLSHNVQNYLLLACNDLRPGDYFEAQIQCA